MLKNISLSNITAGFIAVMVGVTSSVTIIIQAATIAGATPSQISSSILAMGIAMCVTCIGLSFHYRMPILTAWSTPGAALLVTSLSGVTMPEAIGAFLFSAFLMWISGVTGLFEKAMQHIPRSLASAMLAGILFHFGINIFVAMQSQFLLILVLFISYLLGKQLFPRFAIPIVLILGIVLAKIGGLFHGEGLHLVLSLPQLTTPVFSWSVVLGIGIPLYVVTMTSQNVPGFAIMNTSGYHPPASPIISWTGFFSLLSAPFGGFGVNLAAISAAICLSKEADPDPKKRYRAAMWAGVFYLIVGLFGATVVALFSMLPKELISAIAGLALLGTISNSLHAALKDDLHRESAVITLLISASGFSLHGISAAFWGLIAGILSLALLKYLSRLKKPTA